MGLPGAGDRQVSVPQLAQEETPGHCRAPLSPQAAAGEAGLAAQGAGSEGGRPPGAQREEAGALLVSVAPSAGAVGSR